MDLRSRAIMFARNQQLADDAVSAMAWMYDAHVAAYKTPESADEYADKMAQLRIGIDNMLAHAFEVGYEAKVEEPHRKGRSLIDRLRGRKRLTDD